MAVVHGTECHGEVVIWASGLSLSLPSKARFAILEIFGPRYKIWHSDTLKLVLLSCHLIQNRSRTDVHIFTLSHYLSAHRQGV